MSSNSNTPKPKLACEISADRVLAGRVSDNGGGLEASAARELAPGSVVPDLVENNLRQREAVRAGIESVLGSVAGRSKDVIAIVPDAAVRVMLVEFDTLPSDHEEALGVVRFRLKKSLPFDVEKAKVSYHAQKVNDELKVVAAVAMASVIEDYEAAFRDAGFNPGSGAAVDAGRIGRRGGQAADAGDQSRRAHDQHRDPERRSVTAFPHAGKYARRDHHRRATGGRSLSVSGIFSGHVPAQY